VYLPSATIGQLPGAPRTNRSAPGSAGAGTRLHLLGRFSLLVDGQSIPVGASAQRLLALVALAGTTVSRRRAAGTIWPEASPERASANLRSVLWRLQQCPAPVLESSFADLSLPPCVEVDVRHVTALAHRLLDRSVTMDLDHLSTALHSNLHDNLLPDLDDDWLVPERTRYRQLRLHALESLAERLIAAGCFGAAVDTALAAVRADPFRESAHKALILAYLAEGNQNDAYQQFRAYQSTMRRELGLEPSEQLHQLLRCGRPAAR